MKPATTPAKDDHQQRSRGNPKKADTRPVKPGTKPTECDLETHPSEAVDNVETQSWAKVITKSMRMELNGNPKDGPCG